MAPMVPEPVRAGIPGLIKPVCLLLAQVIRFRDQKQNTVNPRAGRRGLAQLKPCKENRVGATATSVNARPPAPPPTAGARAQAEQEEGQPAPGPTR